MDQYASHGVEGGLALTPVLKGHGLGKSSSITLETGNRLVVELSDSLWEDVSGTGDTSLVSRDQGGQ